MPHAVRGLGRCGLLGTLALLAALALSGCGSEDQGDNVDPDQVDAVAAPDLGACRVLTPDDVELPSNATKTVECSEPHTAETFAVGEMPSSLSDADYDDREVGSASGLLESVQQLGASLGVAVLGTLFFHRFALEEAGPVAAVRGGRHLEALEVTLLATVGFLAVAWCLGWLLPRRARAEH